MELVTISEVARTFGVSTRTLRYYEQIGLLSSLKKEGYAYRAYDEQAISRLQQIIFLRRLRIPLKQISIIFDSGNAQTALEVFMRNASELDTVITSLETIREMLNGIVAELQYRTGETLQAVLLRDETVLDTLHSLSATKIDFQEVRPVNDFNNAHRELSKLQNVRIIQLPPFTVASYHYIGENPEEAVGEVISKALIAMKLYENKPDARMFGFNHPNPSKDREYHGYEDWVTIPDDMDVPAPLVKKQFQGGLYAVHTITFPNFHEWSDLTNWVKASDKYECNDAPEGDEIMGGRLEEYLNWIYANHLGWPEDGIDGQLDLYLPVKLKSNL